jgi:hypothetical protein
MTPTRYQLTPVPFTAVQFSDPFWAPRIETNRAATLLHIIPSGITARLAKCASGCVHEIGNSK